MNMIQTEEGQSQAPASWSYKQTIASQVYDTVGGQGKEKKAGPIERAGKDKIHVRA